MTYNFDPEKWYEMQKAALEAKHLAGKINKDELEKALEELDHRYAEMWRRLDGTFEIPE